MPNIKSAKKRVKVNQTKALNNQMQKSALKTAVKKFESSLSGDKAEAKNLYTEAVKKVDKACANGLIHKNKAARKKSQLTVKLNSMGA